MLDAGIAGRLCPVLTVVADDYGTRLTPVACQGCGQLFVAFRRHARTCSHACRQRLYKRRIKAKEGKLPTPADKALSEQLGIPIYEAMTRDEWRKYARKLARRR